MLCSNSACYPAALAVKARSKQEIAMLTHPNSARSESIDSAAFLHFLDMHIKAVILIVNELPHSLSVCKCSIMMLLLCHKHKAKHTASEAYMKQKLRHCCCRCYHQAEASRSREISPQLQRSGKSTCRQTPLPSLQVGAVAVANHAVVVHLPPSQSHLQ